eukprot:1184115-Prorocentrum_minimum.AAC.2
MCIFVRRSCYRSPVCRHDHHTVPPTRGQRALLCDDDNVVPNYYYTGVTNIVVLSSCTLLPTHFADLWTTCTIVPPQVTTKQHAPLHCHYCHVVVAIRWTSSSSLFHHHHDLATRAERLIYTTSRSFSVGLGDKLDERVDVVITKNLQPRNHICDSQQKSHQPSEGKDSRGILKACCTVHKGHKRPKHGVTNVVNTQDSQEQAPCATYEFLGLIQVPPMGERNLSSTRNRAQC